MNAIYLNSLVKIPNSKGKITRAEKGDAVYIYYEYERNYNHEKKYNVPKRAAIGKQAKDDETMMLPNLNFLKYFPNEMMPDEMGAGERSSCLRIGAYIVINSIMEAYRLPEIIGNYFGARDAGLLLDLVAYSIVCENNAGQYYPDYAYNRPLFTDLSSAKNIA